MRAGPRSRTAAWLLLSGLLSACSALSNGSAVREARQDAEQGRPAQAAAKLEVLRTASPNDFEVRLELGVAYYKLARRALDADDQAAYTRYLGQALEEVVEAARIDPESPSPHVWMGIIAAYRDDLELALTSFRNARRLQPRAPVHHLNLAQIYIYQGQLSKARHSIEKGARLGGTGAFLDLVESLAAWRRGDLVEARDLFEQAYGLDPEEVNTWDEAPVDRPITDFRGFTRYCCGNHTCGPHMGQSCGRLDLAVKQRRLRDETLRQELVIEMDRRRKLREIYAGRKDLQIEIEPGAPRP